MSRSRAALWRPPSRAAKRASMQVTDGNPCPAALLGDPDDLARIADGGARRGDRQHRAADHRARSRGDTRQLDLGGQRLPARRDDLAPAALLARRHFRVSARLTAGLLVFTIASLGCAMSSSLLTLTLARVVAGLRRGGHHERQHRPGPLHLPAQLDRPRRRHQRDGRVGVLGARADRRLRHPLGRALALAVRGERADRRAGLADRAARPAGQSPRPGTVRPAERRAERHDLRPADHRDRRAGARPASGERGHGNGRRRRGRRRYWSPGRWRSPRRCSRWT